MDINVWRKEKFSGSVKNTELNKEAYLFLTLFKLYRSRVSSRKPFKKFFVTFSKIVFKLQVLRLI